MTVDYSLYALVVLALGLSLSINVIALFVWLGKKLPNLFYK